MPPLLRNEITTAKKNVSTAMKSLESSGVFSKQQIKALHQLFNSIVTCFNVVDETKLDRNK